MPTRAFYNLSKEKQQLLLEAAKREFSRVLLEDASINKIIQEIHMPRGTFYLYFKNKEELYFHIMMEYLEKIYNYMNQSLKKHDGDIILACMDFFDYLVVTCKEKGTLEHHIFLNMNYRTQNHLFKEEWKFYPDEGFDPMFEHINLDLLNVREKTDVKTAIRLLMIVTMHSITETLLYEIPMEQVRTNYLTELELLKNGLYRKDGTYE